MSDCLCPAAFILALLVGIVVLSKRKAADQASGSGSTQFASKLPLKKILMVCVIITASYLLDEIMYTSCLGPVIFIVVLYLFYLLVSKQKLPETSPPTPVSPDTAPSAQEMPGIEPIPAVEMPFDTTSSLEQGRTLIRQGNRAEAVAFLMHAFREGPPDVRQEAVRLLEELGEIKTF